LITEKEFKRFISTLNDCEVLQESTVSGQRRVDYLLNARTIVADLKTLSGDASAKISKLLEESGITFYGSAPFDLLIKGRPDAEELNRKAFGLVNTSLESHFRKADQQIEATKEEFNLKDALGLIIVVNNGNLALEPHVVVKAASRLLMKASSGETRYPSIHGCLYLCENHPLRHFQIPNHTTLPALNIVATSGQPYDALSTYIDKLIRAWCAFRGIRYIDGESRIEIL
jgi:hypothetical protein